MEVKNIGIKFGKVKGNCNDNNCPFHGNLKCRGRIFSGTVISVKMQKTAIVEWERKYFLGKYERYEKRRSTVKAHIPGCVKVNDGDIVKIMECRPLSKTKNFVIVKVLGEEKGFKERMESEDEAKFKEHPVKKEGDVNGDKIKDNKEARGM